MPGVGNFLLCQGSLAIGPNILNEGCLQYMSTTASFDVASMYAVLASYNDICSSIVIFVVFCSSSHKHNGLPKSRGRLLLACYLVQNCMG